MTPRNHGPWITPQLQNGWRHAEDNRVRWRVPDSGGFQFRGNAVPPEDPEKQKLPLFQMNAIYKHLFGQTMSFIDYQPFASDRVVYCTIDEDGWIFIHIREIERSDDANV